MNIQMTLQYEGTRYRGWQKQKNTKDSIQEKLEEVLSQVTAEPIEVHAAGRTDLGVHAMGQVIHFHTKIEKAPSLLLKEANALLPFDIRILDAKVAPERFHARLNAKGKHYCYRIRQTDHPDVFGRRIEWCFGTPLNQNNMEEAAELLCGTYDFRGLCDEKKKDKKTIRSIFRIEFEKEADLMIIHYYGDGFLYHMVRKITALLVEVGSGRMKPTEVTMFLQGEKRHFDGLAPALGLMLCQVYYE